MKQAHRGAKNCELSRVFVKSGLLALLSLLSVEAIKAEPLLPPPAPSLCLFFRPTVDIGAGQSPTDGDDRILGTEGPDLINGLDGDDIICGGGGEDIITGGRGDDYIDGQAGNDNLNGNSGDDLRWQ